MPWHSQSFRKRIGSAIVAALFVVSGCLAIGKTPSEKGASENRSAQASAALVAAHFDEVQRADYCAGCHPAEVAEHRANTHGRAFSDPEARMATGRFSLGTCIDCHTPRPVFETGIGMNPIKRLHHLEEGNSCLTCHQRGGYDMAQFRGGAEGCRAAFDPRVGTVEACASCHKNHGTPYQWEHAAHGNKAGRVCIDCHMPTVVRPPASGVEPRRVRRHTFFAGHSESQIRRAYTYGAKLEGNEVLVEIENSGVGHNFPTELKQRSVESLIQIFDREGKEIARSRKVFRDPYKRPYGLNLPVNTQIPSGETREHRIPIPLADGVVETTLFFKQYYPIEDYHPNLSLTLESRTLPFSGIKPSEKPIDSGPEIHAALPEAIPAEVASPANLADFPHPPIGKVEVDIPDGSKEGDIEKLIALLQFPVLEANRKAVDVLVSLKNQSIPALVDALGSWDNKTWSQAQAALARIGEPAREAVLAALEDPRLYVRFHAREIVPKMKLREAEPILARTLRSKEPLDRRGSAWALAEIDSQAQAAAIRSLLEDRDPDVVAVAALSLAKLDAKDAAGALRLALERWPMVETRRDLAYALAALGEPEGVATLVDLLDYPDDLIRESVFERFFAVTARHENYHPMLEPKERLHAIARIRAWWEKEGGRGALRRPPPLPQEPLRGEIEHLVRTMGGNDFFPDDPEKSQEALVRLIEIGDPAVPQVIQGFKWPPGFAKKRAMLCQFLVQNPDPEALPWLLWILEDPVVEVALWALRAIESTGERSVLPGVKKFEARYEALATSGKLPTLVESPDSYRVMIARTRIRLGDVGASRGLLRILWTGDPAGRRLAEAALREFCDSHGRESSNLVEEAASQLQKLDQERAGRAASLRMEWERIFEEAARAAEQAKRPAEWIAALEKFDRAEEAVSPLASIDAALYGRILRDTRSAAEEVAWRLYSDPSYEDSLAWLDLLAPEGKGWKGESGGIVRSKDGASTRIETTEAQDGNPPLSWLRFLPAGPAPWRDYVLDLEFTVSQGGFTVRHRESLDGRPGFPISFSAAENSILGFPPIREKVAYRAVHRIWGNSISERRAESGADLSQAMEDRVGLERGSGGVLFLLEPGARVEFSRLRIKVLR